MPPTFSSIRALEIADAAVELAPVRGHPAAVARRQPGHQRHHASGDQRQLRLDREHQGEGADERHDRDEQVLRPVVGDFADLFEILGEAADEVPGLLVVEEAEGQFLQVVERLTAHLRLDVDAEHVTPVGHDGHQPGVGDVDGEQAGAGERDEPPLARRQQRVDEDLDGDGEAELQQAGENGAGEVEQEQAAVGAVVGEEAGTAKAWRDRTRRDRRKQARRDGPRRTVPPPPQFTPRASRPSGR